MLRAEQYVSNVKVVLYVLAKTLYFRFVLCVVIVKEIASPHPSGEVTSAVGDTRQFVVLFVF